MCTRLYVRLYLFVDTFHVVPFLVFQLRAVWYVTEVMAQENTDMDNGIVFVAWVKDMTMWDFDLSLYDSINYFDKSCWPVKIIASHICCRLQIVVKYIKPILNVSAARGVLCGQGFVWAGALCVASYCWAGNG